jgi:tetratricopeptide (TPR) repeat protein
MWMARATGSAILPLRKVLLDRMEPARRSALHVRSAEWTLASAKDSERMAANIEAGWHYLQAGDETRGADLLADVAYDTVGIRFAFADLQVVAPALEAALRVYERKGRSVYDRLPLLSALTQAGYYEDRAWGERYGEEALKVLRQVSGLDLVGKLQRWMGKWVGLLLGMTVAWMRFTAARKARRYGFWSVLVQLFGVVTTMTGAAILALDGPRAERVARTLHPFAFLPARLTPKGIWEFCTSLAEISRENQAEALRTWTRLIEHFNDPRYYPTLPAPARALYLGGLWFARGVFESFRDRGGALDAAEALDRIGLKLYQMIASQLRALHYANRGELAEAERHKAQVELHALHVGSAWQAELWDPCAHIPTYTTLRDLVESRRVVDRIETLARTAPSLALHGELAHVSCLFLREDAAAAARIEAILAQYPPRSFIGWGAVCGFYAEYLNHRGAHDAALAASERAIEHLNEADREFVSLFLNLELQHAFALLGLGRVDEAASELEALCERHAASDNPLTQGQLHEGRARLAAAEGAWDRFDLHLGRAMEVYRATGTTALMARAEGLKHLRPEVGGTPGSDQLQRLGDLAEQAAQGDAQPLLEWLASAWGAESCALFVLRDGRLQLQCALGEEPPTELNLEVSMCVGAWHSPEPASEGTATTTATVPGRAAMRASVRGYAVRLLVHGSTVVGALALRSSGSLSALPDGALLDRVTEGLLRGADQAAHA